MQDTASTVARERWLEFDRRVDWGAVWAWILGFAPIVYLGLEGGGFDLLVFGRAAIAVFWALLAGVAVGAFPRDRLGPFVWCALGLLAGFVAWTALSLAWTESVEQSWDELARVAAYLGAFALILFACRSGSRRHLAGGLACGVVVIAVVALLSRLHPSWIPSASQVGDLLPAAQERLSYPLDYWNGLAALIAIGIPAVLQAAIGAKSTLLRGAAAAALPALALVTYLTLSRGGTAAAAIGIVVFLALSRGPPAEAPDGGHRRCRRRRPDRGGIPSQRAPARPARRDRPPPGEPDARHDLGRLPGRRDPPGRDLAAPGAAARAPAGLDPPAGRASPRCSPGRCSSSCSLPRSTPPGTSPTPGPTSRRATPSRCGGRPD